MTVWAELHLHLEGTLTPELIFELAERNQVRLPYRDLADLRSRYEFDNLQSFLDLYYANMVVLQQPQDFTDMVNAYLARAAQAGVRHAEVFFDLQAHLGRGVPAEVALAGVDAALRDSQTNHGITTGLILSFLRHLPPADAMDAYRQARATGVELLGVGLCSTEVGIAASDFAEVFEQARADGLHTVSHAGEEGGADYIWEVLNTLGVERVDHGVHCVEDPALVEHLVATQIPLTMCPLSNVRLKVVKSLADHPVIDLFRAGVNVTINSDDPSYFGGYLDDNVAAVTEQFELSDAEVTALARNSIRASFASPERKDALLALLGGPA